MKKIIIITASVLVAVGIIFVGLAFAFGGTNSQINEATYRTDEDFSKISVETGSADITIEKSENGKAYAVCDETKDITFSFSVKNGTLVLEEEVKSIFAYVGINFSPRNCVLYLPEGEYSELIANTASGSIECAEKSIIFNHAELATSSGDIKLSTPITEWLKCESTSGKIKVFDIAPDFMTLSSSSGVILIENITSCSKIEAETASGNINLSTVKPTEISLHSSSGKVSMKDVVAVTEMNVTTSSGDITFVKCDAEEITFKSGSGKIEGSLLSDKLFDVKTDSGSKKYPPSIRDGGKCTIKTSSGDINIEIAE